ncbi:ABC transporter ATP-binding protein [Mechercharimyces sp. CAU 1602]|uniref:ABC transporter ATP-binding protein n=1 Tax=Mechercharimyces sp. CAU 1602 TaxID=2973933 RepID=UPI0021610D2F|nr:ABC transporter ATP-binding protein [Mechercharimyces sp. CAU 1602]MCS1351464.1 ABC transporter ATP-binding protein [Mechercharimyces sp. CAU 1602]
MENHVPALQLVKVSKTYLQRSDVEQAIAGINFTIAPREFVSLIGPSGCGKSTILSLIAGLIQPSSGNIFVHGKKVATPSRSLGYMLQRDCLLPWRTVDENIMLGLEIRKQLTTENKELAQQLLHELGLSHVRFRYPAQLSGGMRQRVALVRTLVLRPSVLLLDEPFSAVDFQTKCELEELLTAVLQQQGQTALLVTHDLEEALAVSDRILIMGGQPSRITKEINLPDDLRQTAPLQARGHPQFRSLFEELWRELKGGKE